MMDITEIALLSQTPTGFAESMKKDNINSGYIVTTKTGMEGSSPLFEKLAKEIVKMKDFSNHEAIFIKYDDNTECLFMVFVHSTKRGQSQGGTRLKYKGYETIEGSIKDGMRLSKGMTDKNSIAEIWWGGGKAIICPINATVFTRLNEQKIDSNNKPMVTSEGLKDFTAESIKLRKILFSNYGKFIASLGGVYVAAEDMFTDKRDMKEILSNCRFVTCLPEDVGGSGNPSGWTAKGVRNAMLATVKYFEGFDTLEGKTINIQGIGNVGDFLAQEVLLHGASAINIYDPNTELAERNAVNYKTVFPNRQINIVSEDEIYFLKCDIFAPCAIGGILNPRKIPILNCKYVIGAANNQLENFDADYKLLADRGIVYLPDFFINRLGIINCANEQYGYLESDLQIQVDKVYDGTTNGTLHLLEQCSELGKVPQEIALEMATRLGQIPHPWWANRGSDIITKLINPANKLW